METKMYQKEWTVLETASKWVNILLSFSLVSISLEGSCLKQKQIKNKICLMGFMTH
jgi:hypothetical protein